MKDTSLWKEVDGEPRAKAQQRTMTTTNDDERTLMDEKKKTKTKSTKSNL